MNLTTVSAAELKSHLSEYLSKVAHGQGEIMVTRHRRPAAVLVPVQVYEALGKQRRAGGLLAVRKAFRDFGRIATAVAEAQRQRAQGGSGRHVSL